MNSIWSNSIDQTTSLFYKLPNALKKMLEIIYQQHYEEFYELDSQGKICLQDALDNILDSFKSNNPTLTHLRYVWMALIMSSVVEPTVKYYDPNSIISEETIRQLTIWLIETLKGMQFSKSAKKEEISKTLNSLDSISINYKISSFQILCEALNVYKNATKTLNLEQSLEALMDILDDCLEGYAIFPGSDGRENYLTGGC